jgi:hypothetical protein
LEDTLYTANKTLNTMEKFCKICESHNQIFDFDTLIKNNACNNSRSIGKISIPHDLYKINGKLIKIIDLILKIMDQLMTYPLIMYGQYLDTSEYIIQPPLHGGKDQISKLYLAFNKLSFKE